MLPNAKLHHTFGAETDFHFGAACTRQLLVQLCALRQGLAPDLDRLAPGGFHPVQHALGVANAGEMVGQFLQVVFVGFLFGKSFLQGLVLRFQLRIGSHGNLGHACLG